MKPANTRKDAVLDANDGGVVRSARTDASIANVLT